MINREAIENFKHLVARNGLELADFDLEYETAASCGTGEPKDSGDRIIIRYRPSRVEKTYPVTSVPSWMDEFTRDLQNDFYRTQGR